MDTVISAVRFMWADRADADSPNLFRTIEIKEIKNTQRYPNMEF